MKSFSNFKWFNITLILLLVCNMVAAQTRYTVYKCTGNVTVKKFRTDTWKMLSRNEILSLMDLVKVEEGASFAILDTRTKKIYKSSLKGEKLVKYRIDEAIKDADKITATLNNEIFSQLKEQNINTKEHSRIAAAFRGNDTSPGLIDSLAAFIRQQITTIPGEKGYSVFSTEQISPDSFVLNKTVTADDEYWLSVKNNSNNEVFANVVRISEDGSCSLCYEFGYTSEAEYIIIPANSKIELRQYLFANCVNEKYLLLVTDVPYDTRTLQSLLQSK